MRQKNSDHGNPGQERKKKELKYGVTARLTPESII
jgi:hypothetical protein